LALKTSWHSKEHVSTKNIVENKNNERKYKSIHIKGKTKRTGKFLIKWISMLETSPNDFLFWSFAKFYLKTSRTKPRREQEQHLAGSKSQSIYLCIYTRKNFFTLSRKSGCKFYDAKLLIVCFLDVLVWYCFQY
jgi:hypothetical protein